MKKVPPVTVPAATSAQIQRSAYYSVALVNNIISSNYTVLGRGGQSNWPDQLHPIGWALLGLLIKFVSKKSIPLFMSAVKKDQQEGNKLFLSPLIYVPPETGSTSEVFHP